MFTALLTGEEAKAADAYTISEIGIPSALLMQRAASAVADCVCRAFPASADLRVLSVCGYGNNGGDGVAAARLLLRKGYRAEVFLIGNKEHATSECMYQIGLYKSAGGQILSEDPLSESSACAYDVIIDALTGVGLKGGVRPAMAEKIRAINNSGAYIVSVDIPSGVDAENGHADGGAVCADETVTFSYYKRGHFLYPGKAYCGKLSMEDVGIVRSEDAASDTAAGKLPCVTMNAGDAGRLLPKRIPRSNKGTYGKALLVCGKINMAGAAVMAVSAALRSGAGLVMSVSDSENRIILQSQTPEAVFSPWGLAETSERVRSWANAVGCGCGLGTDENARALVKDVLASDASTIVLDADALNVIAQMDGFPAHEGKQIIITPHPGEMSRLSGKTIKEILDDPVQAALDYAKENHVIVVLKDAATVVTDGNKIYINQTGCPGMSKGGSGDVLTGLMTGLCAQKEEAFEMAILAVYLHGLAGQIAQNIHGAYAMTAMDIVRSLGGAYALVTGEEQRIE